MGRNPKLRADCLLRLCLALQIENYSDVLRVGLDFLENYNDEFDVLRAWPDIPENYRDVLMVGIDFLENYSDVLRD